MELVIKPAVSPEVRHKIENLLEEEGYNVIGGGTMTDLSSCDISFEEEELKMKTIIFDAEGTGKSAKCYRVGLLGCTKIESIFEGEAEGIAVYSYNVHFDSGHVVKITTTIYVSDE